MQSISEHQQVIDSIGLLIQEQQRTNEAITALAEALAGKAPAPTTPEPSPAVEEPDTSEPVWEEPNLTKDQLQAYCMKRVREDKTFKQALMATLAEYGVKTIGKLKGEQAPEVYTKLELIK